MLNIKHYTYCIVNLILFPVVQIFVLRQISSNYSQSESWSESEKQSNLGIDCVHRHIMPDTSWDIDMLLSAGLKLQLLTRSINSSF